MWTAVPKSRISWDFVVRDAAQQPVAEVKLTDRERGTVEVGSVQNNVTRKGALGAFLLERGGAVLASAEKPGAFKKAFEIEHGGRHFTLKKRTGWRREVVLSEGGNEIGSIAPDGWFTRSARVGLPEALPLDLRLFAIWLTLLLWKRATDASNSGGV